jgi:hypothetical protein
MLEVPDWPPVFERLLAEQEKDESMDIGGDESAGQKLPQNDQVEDQRDVEVETPQGHRRVYHQTTMTLRRKRPRFSQCSSYQRHE